ncbi:transposase [Burkholderia stabilis]|jgi:putative transposase|nr:transposase mutator type [Burkholderia orbicola MC0-3]AMU13166.1 transposase [Burkholderia cenocepacia]AOR67044.1 transposase [Burkholderia stabilis]EAY62692.1 Transposase [Burkholderia cenocepacia PC184]KKL34554.1 transposase [Burkholderia contaminans LMG 23361]KVS35707.1 transposase [Burkholderia vietnamiensis]ODN26698.1 transposase [Burkholderia contaminans]PZW88454.1 transposase-like protein [Burkholderia sp. 28_3]VWC55086.1 transposase, mutator family [Burkholderia aenigmatica]
MDMPMKKKRQTVARQAAARGPLPELPKELLDQLVKGPMTPTEVQDLMLAFNKAIIERAMGAEMNLHLGYPSGQSKPTGQANERNGASGKTVITDRGPVRVEVPRDRDGSFEPILIPKHERRFTGFDERIIAMYARGMSVREIQGFLAEHYGTEVSPDFISSVTDEVMAEALSWQNRPLEPMYPVVFFDALRVKIRDDGVVSNKAVYLALGIQADGQRDVLGLWIEQTEGAKFWLKVFNELKTRGCQDILIAVVDGLKGLTEAISAAYPRTTVQTCIVHLIRNSLEYASYKDRKALATALRPIYAAASEEAARQALQDFADGPWGEKYPTIVQSWQRAWEHVIPFFVFPPEIRRVVYTTNAIESLNMQLRKIIKTRGHFPNDEAAIKLLWLALRNVLAKTVRAAFDWKSAMNQFAILFGERFTQARG